MTSLRNHRDAIAAMDFFVVPTLTFRMLYVWFAIEHGRRRILDFHVTDHPEAAWVVQQLREAFARFAPARGIRMNGLNAQRPGRPAAVSSSLVCCAWVVTASGGRRPGPISPAW